MDELVRRKPPKVFLSHATEDKNRFVLDFARKLRDRGVDVWLDYWELYPSDSLIDKIYEEGLKEADAVIVVISAVSITKAWVREELNAAAVNRITRGCMLIPVVIDDCEVPEALRSLVWQQIPDLENYAAELDRIVATIFNQRERPPLGNPPGYIEATPLVEGLSRTDTVVLKAFGDEVLASGDSVGVGTEDIWRRVEPLGLPRQEFEDSLRVLAEIGLLEEGREIAPFPTYFSSTVSGLETYSQAFVQDYESTKRSVCATILNTDLTDNDEIAEKLGQPVVLVTHIFEELEARGFLRVDHALGGKSWVSNVSPRLRRTLGN
ncbi:MAG TPA: toll/interleukin-1 receptor domain-containing protein [Thermoanaerobaculia bacterium]|nr:toll/interleukin-1 receptor domain-containing protein [Thermoanaerobaculia bacterium]